MPLSPARPRELLHQRDITLRGYRREDGLFDIEAELTDTKSYPFELDERGPVPPGGKLHGMAMRMTVNEDMLIVACEAATDFSPYSICPSAAPAFASLAGLTVQPGFLKAAATRVGHAAGCTHLRELLQQMATVVYQTLYPVRAAKLQQADEAGARPALLNSCKAYATDSPVVERRWPQFFTGSRETIAG